MLTHGRSAVAVVGLVCVGTLAVGLSASGAVGILDGVSTLRALLVVCAIAVFGVAVASLPSGRHGQAAGHAVAGVGFLVAAAVGTGGGVWIGVGLAGVGGILLLRDALRRTGRNRPTA